MTSKEQDQRRVEAATIAPAAIASAALNFWNSGRYDTFTIARILGCSEATVCCVLDDARQSRRGGK
ncbi:MAG: hypothetical protein ACK4PN_08510 [Allorhizobium sp.]